MFTRRKIAWVGNSTENLKKFPATVKDEIGHALHLIQIGEKPDNIKPLKGLNPKVVEIVCNFDTNTYRAIYTIKLGEYIYVLHCFQKKSKSGIKTPQKEIDLIKRRLRQAKEFSAKGNE